MCSTCSGGSKPSSRGSSPRKYTPPKQRTQSNSRPSQPGGFGVAKVSRTTFGIRRK